MLFLLGRHRSVARASIKEAHGDDYQGRLFSWTSLERGTARTVAVVGKGLVAVEVDVDSGR